MKKNIFKKLFDNIILAIFIILCICGFFLLIVELPNELNSLLNTNIFEGTNTLFFFFFVFILGYMLIYYNNKHSNEEHKNSIDNINNLSKTINLLNYINNYDYTLLNTISYTYYKGINDFHIIFKNNKDIQLNIVFLKADFLYNLDLKILDDCLSTYNGDLDNFKITLYIQNNYRGRT